MCGTRTPCLATKCIKMVLTVSHSTPLHEGQTLLFAQVAQDMKTQMATLFVRTRDSLPGQLNPILYQNLSLSDVAPSVVVLTRPGRAGCLQSQVLGLNL